MNVKDVQKQMIFTVWVAENLLRSEDISKNKHAEQSFLSLDVLLHQKKKPDAEQFFLDVLVQKKSKADAEQVPPLDVLQQARC